MKDTLFKDDKRFLRRPYIKRAHYSSHKVGDEGYTEIRYTCKRCRWQSEWKDYESKKRLKRGIPCHNCNVSYPNKMKE